MTYQEAKERFSKERPYLANHDWKIAYYLAEQSLEKQIPKKPKETDAYPHRLYCPYCTWTLCYNKENANSFRMMHMFRYCPECGQAIDWSDAK